MKICRRLISAVQEGKWFRLLTDAVELRVIFLTDDIVRIRAGFDGDDFPEESYSLVLTAWPDRMDGLLKAYRRRIEAAGAELQETENTVTLKGRHLTVAVRREPFAIRVLDREGSVLHEDIPFLGWQCDGNGRRIHTSAIGETDAFYGFGERTGPLNKREMRMVTAPGDCMGYNPKETDCLYKHIPFYIRLDAESGKAVGYFYHTTWACEFDMGRARSNYTKLHSSVRIDGGDLDLFLIAGPSIKSVIERYTDLTGKSVLLPKAALGYLGSSMYYPELPAHADDAILDFVGTARAEGIPIDGFQLSSGYCEVETGEGMKRCTFLWNREKFPDPAEFFRRMREKDILVSPNVKPGMLLTHPYAEEMAERGMFVRSSGGDGPAVGLWWGGMGCYVDFTSEAARSAWKEYLKRDLIAYGTTSIWNDNCEYEGLFDRDARVSFEGKGAPIAQTAAVMSNLMCQTAVEAVQETAPGTRAFVVCRSGHAGIQRYAQTWAGDNLTCWDSLKYNIATILGMGLSGVSSHGCDIGGFYGPAPDEELFLRWVQNGIFQPRFSIHSTNTDNTVTEPWMYHGILKALRSAMEFRYRLIPYLYSLAYRASVTGLPIMEAMVLAFQNDRACRDESVNFMLGESLLVANVVEHGAKEREIYLPRGTVFYDFYTRERYEGGQTITVPVTLESIPLFLRSGAILPLAMNQLHSLASDQVTGLHLILVPDEDARFTLYDDDGTTLDWQRGIFRRTEITMKAGERTVIRFAVTGTYPDPVETMLLDVVHREKAPQRVTLNGAALPHFLYRPKFEAAEQGWYYSQTLKSVLIRYPNPKADHEAVLFFEAADLIGMQTEEELKWH